MIEMNNKSPRLYESPVAWLLGKQLIGSLKGALLYTAYGQKLDPRDWMTGNVINLEDSSKTEFWFDYLSDAGDGTKAMYSIAYLALTKLWTRLDPNATALPASESDRKVSTLNDGGENFTFSLPRGEFLFMGGDTSYHASDYMTLVNRIQHPFNYAYEDLRARKLISDEEPRRPIFGIPGNHDYYDQIDGFRRQFRKPIRKEGPFPPKQASGHDAQLTVAGFKREQEASYIAIHLPFKWWLWGLDTESVSNRTQNLDLRQERFFKEVSARLGGPKLPEKLIVATCAPSTVFGRIAQEDDQKTVRPQATLKIDLPFLPPRTAGEPDFTKTGDATLKAGQCRLDLSGDVHHYARYWGPNAPAGPSPRQHNTAPRPSAQSYASVVSGAGGAFHHPSTTYDNEICEQVLYPSEANSRAVVADRIFKFWNVMTGGYVWLAGLIIAFTIYFGIAVPQSSRQFVNNVGFVNALEFADRTDNEPITPTIVRPGTEPCQSIQPFSLWTKLGLAAEEWKPVDCTAATPTYFLRDIKTWPLDLVIGQVFIFLALAAVLLTFHLSVFTKKIFTDASAFDTSDNPDNKLLLITIPTAFLMIVALFTLQPYHNLITPFVNSLIVLFCIFTAITAFILNLRYAEYLFRKSFVDDPNKCWANRLRRKMDDYLPWFFSLLAVVIAACGLWFFGRNNLPAYLVSDILFFIVLLAGIGAILVLPFKVAGELLYPKSKPVQIIGKTLIGIWHLVLQLLVPFLLIRNGNYITWILAIALLLIPIPLAKVLLQKNSRVGLSLLWLVYGGVMLALPWITAWILGRDPNSIPVFANFTGWWGLLPSILAGITGAIICCLWTGWYFAVCFIFNGHNNEIGGAARIEGFKQFIRFRLNETGLTGYVIAVDDVSQIGEEDRNGHVKDGSDLSVRLIDVFHLTPKKN